jgi:uncharacterized glyoxalase superfamily protein PhnB
MRDFRDAKAMAASLRQALTAQGVPITHSQALELVAKQFGDDNWNILAARIGEGEAKPAPDAVTLAGATPILRIFDLAKAEEFYLDFLGFTADWGHQRGDTAPVYMQVSRSGLTLHLSEHHGDASPGATVYVETRGLEAYHRELAAKAYRFNRPGLEETDYGHRILQAHDPFGNRLRFSERVAARS